MAQFVPADDLPSGLVPEDDLPRKTPKQMREEPSFLEKAGSYLKARAPLAMQLAKLTPPGAAMGALNKFGEFAEEAGGRVTDVGAKMGLPPEIAAGAGYATNVGLNAIPAFLGGPAKLGQVALKDVVKMGTLKEGRELGLNVPPSAVGSGHVERGIESLGGKADIGREMSARNREAIQVVARREAGIPKDQPITEETLALARQSISKPYDEIAAISPRAKTALEQMRTAREEAKGHWREYNGPNHPMAAQKEARRLDAKADAYEKLIDIEATKAGRPDLLPALQQARVQLAKNYDIEKALNIGTGEIDARMIGKMVDKRGTKAVTGDLQTVGKFAQAFPDFVQPKDVARDVSMLRPYLALGALGGGGALSEHYTGTPYGMALGALPFISPAARALALSKLMQSGALGAGRSGERAIQSSLIPLSQLGRDDDNAR